jgi:hypothetical protein
MDVREHEVHSSVTIFVMTRYINNGAKVSTFWIY